MKVRYRFEGTAASYVLLNSNNSGWERGAFRELDGKRVPLAWMHEQEFEDHEAECTVRETPNGIDASGWFEVDDQTRVGAEIAADIAGGRLRGLSISVSRNGREPKTYDQRWGSRCKDIFEISLVTKAADHLSNNLKIRRIF